ncbi:MAG: translation elongation factor-like protein [Candidatus Pacebacteria bacterium]|jgi:putative protease|nr:translation elongation factor-like protein [Candidatus Paceibacterota bacterium]
MTEEKPIGKITHYFPKVQAAIVKLNSPLKIGDKIKLKKDEEEFEQEVKSMQVDHTDITKAKKGDEVGIKVDKKVKENWEVYKA